jgi:peroxiredoxin
MAANLCLITCALLVAQSADRGEGPVTARLGRGQELIYRGTYAEETRGKGAEFSHSFLLETRVFVLESNYQGSDLALFTILRDRQANTTAKGEPELASVRLELAHVDVQGRIAPKPGGNLTLPLEGPATIEAGMFVDLPQGRLGAEKQWEVADGARPPRSWKVLGTEVLNRTRCVKLEGVQQSDDWDQSRADHTAWRRRDTIWLAPEVGVAYKVERVLERRAPAHDKPGERSVVEYELLSNLQFPGKLFEDRQHEIFQASRFHDQIAPLLPDPNRWGRYPFDQMLAVINHHLENEPATPYREAVLLVKRRVEAARRGESLPQPPAEESARETLVAGLGQRAPDFVATNLLTGETVRLRRCQSTPMLLVFYTPASLTAERVLRFAQKVQDAQRQGIKVLGFAVTDDSERARKQHEQLGLSFPLLAGMGLRLSYAVDATPKLIVLDADGVVRGTYTGWGPETPDAVAEDLRACPQKKGSGARDQGPGTRDQGFGTRSEGSQTGRPSPLVPRP